jgi:hypothetical protein
VPGPVVRADNCVVHVEVRVIHIQPIRNNGDSSLTEGDRQAGNDEDLAGHGQLVRQKAGYILNVDSCYSCE